MGLEPTTPCLKGRCSNQLSYGPTLVNVRLVDTSLHILPLYICYRQCLRRRLPERSTGFVKNKSSTATLRPIAIIEELLFANQV